LKETKQLENHKSLSNLLKQNEKTIQCLKNKKNQKSKKIMCLKNENTKKKVKPLRNFLMKPKLDSFEKINLI